MTTGDIPQLSTASYTTNTYTPLGVGGLMFDGTAIGGMSNMQIGDLGWDGLQQQQANYRAYNQLASLAQANLMQPYPQQEKPKVADKISRRIVKVYIMDPDENVPLDKSLLYEGDETLTDLTDQELFFEVDIKTILADHNTYRKTLVNKKIKDRTEHLDAVKIRELKMVVVEIAKF